VALEAAHHESRRPAFCPVTPRSAGLRTARFAIREHFSPFRHPKRRCVRRQFAKLAMFTNPSIRARVQVW
jgi:hypothetical protein